MSKSIFFRIFIFFLAVLMVNLAVFGIFLGASVKVGWEPDRKALLKFKVDRIINELREKAPSGNIERLKEICADSEGKYKVRIWLRAMDGETIYGMSKIIPDPKEFLETSSKNKQDVKPAYIVDYPNLLVQRLCYATSLNTREGDTIGFVFICHDYQSFIGSLLSSSSRVLILGICITLSSLLFAFAVAKSLTYPLLRLKKSVRLFFEGDLRQRVPKFETEEFAQLGDSLNLLFCELEQRLQEITQRHEELNTILSNMREAVIAVDYNEKIISVNRAAMEFLSLQSSRVQGRYVHEVVRNSEILIFINDIVKTGKPSERELLIHSADHRRLHLRGTPMISGNGKNNGVTGVLVVFSDITKLRKLETMRRDFVANVSHEIKTPITAIRGSVETLMDGAMDSKKDMKRFLRIIMKHSERLNALVEDILSLSLIDEQTDRGKIIKNEAITGNIVFSVVELCATKAQSKNITLRTANNDNILLHCNQQLIEQALINLVDNAIKFTDENGEVKIEYLKEGDMIKFSVIDKGCGIPKDSIDRIFERFYMVDKARSRKMGGTGLGLSIVKHIAQMHDGRVDVFSEPGKGSVFSLLIPCG